MKTVTLDIRSPSDAMTDFVHAWNTGKPQRSARISFATPELLWQVLTAERWELLKALYGAGPVSIANCEFAQELFSTNQPHYRGSMYSAIKIKYWCEKGRFKK
jgi:predicted transcriptional regulator